MYKSYVKLSFYYVFCIFMYQTYYFIKHVHNTYVKHVKDERIFIREGHLSTTSETINSTKWPITTDITLLPTFLQTISILHRSCLLLSSSSKKYRTQNRLSTSNKSVFYHK